MFYLYLKRNEKEKTREKKWLDMLKNWPRSLEVSMSLFLLDSFKNLYYLKG